MDRELLVEMGYEDSLVFDSPSYDDAIVGVTTDDRIVYSYEKMVEQLMQEMGCERIDAIDFLEYNTVRALAYMGNDAPIIVTFL
jgi:pyoverdine/dityrosine biosynthesis protein Dit1